MNETAEYAVIRARVRGGDPTVYLIETEDLRQNNDLAAYFPSGTTDIQEVGRIQILGDTHLLGMMYAESM